MKNELRKGQLDLAQTHKQFWSAQSEGNRFVHVEKRKLEKVSRFLSQDVWTNTSVHFL